MNQQERLDWLRERQKGIGGSDVGAILGVDKFRTPLDVYLSKIGDVRELDTAPIRRGRRLERVAREMYQELHPERSVEEAPLMQYSDEYPQLFVNLDGTFTEKVTGDSVQLGTLELKAPGLRMFATMRASGLPQSYLLQVQHGLGISKQHVGAFAAYSAERDEMLHLDILPDYDLIRQTQEILSQWWEIHVVKRSPPEEKEPFKLSDDAKVPAGEVTRIITPEFLTLAARYWEARELSDMAEELLDEEKAKLIEGMGGALVVETDDYRFIHRHTKGRTSFERKSLEAIQPLDPRKLAVALQGAKGGTLDDPEKFTQYLIERCKVDFSEFEKTGAPSQPFKPYRLKKGVVSE